MGDVLKQLRIQQRETANRRDQDSRLNAIKRERHRKMNALLVAGQFSSFKIILIFGAFAYYDMVVSANLSRARNAIFINQVWITLMTDIKIRHNSLGINLIDGRFVQINSLQ